MYHFTLCLLTVSSVSYAQWSSTNDQNVDIYRNGRVGIGTTSFAAKLDVRTAGAAGSDQYALYLKNPSSAAYAAVELTMASGANSYAVIHAQRNNLTKGGTLIFQTSDATEAPVSRMMIDDAGHVGIGTLSPAALLHINAGNYASILLGDNSSGGVSITKEANNRLAFWNNGVYGSSQYERFTILQNGNIGIGTSAPLAQLHINNNNYGSILLGDGSSGGGVAITKESDNRIAFWNNGIYGSSQSERFTILQNGNVGIGTNNPGPYKLAVDGKIFARGVKVSLGTIADYVFDSTYQLRSLSSLEQYINQNKHLPGIPSAEQVKKEGGIELQEMNVKLLEKVEELTLYVIELKKENEQIKKELKKSSKQKK